jgi:hypothetical protein
MFSPAAVRRKRDRKLPVHASIIEQTATRILVTVRMSGLLGLGHRR